MKWSAYWRLMRFHKPVGILLLWWPTAWALWIANRGCPSWQILIYFLMGTIFMRAAGCVINDMADRNIDKHVKRTSARPLTTGELSVLEALGLLLLLLIAPCIILIQLPIPCFYYALGALCITVFYPFCKRFFQAPQFILGVAFSMGIPMAFAASGCSINYETGLLMLLNFSWIVAYDTMYAMVDRTDDLLIGVKSTAILFAAYDRMVIMFLQIFLHALWLILALNHPYSWWFYSGWMVGGGILMYQQTLVNSRKEDACFKAFTINVWYGLVMWVSLCGAQ